MPRLLSTSKSYTRTTEPASVFSTGARSASAAPSAMAAKAESNVGRGTVAMDSPRSPMAAASLKAPRSPWKATRSGGRRDEAGFVSDAKADSVLVSAAANAQLEIGAAGSIIQRMMPKRAAVTRPQSDEYAPYYETYVSLIPGDDIVGALETQRVQMAQLLAARSEREGNFRYAPGKWSVKEVIGHICDAERIFAYRLLRIARGDETPLASFEQNDYIAPGAFGERTLADLAAEFAAVRAATMALVQSLTAEAWVRRGTASGKTVSARALAYIIAGHEVHHRKILDEKYFPAIPRA